MSFWLYRPCGIIFGLWAVAFLLAFDVIRRAMDLPIREFDPWNVLDDYLSGNTSTVALFSNSTNSSSYPGENVRLPLIYRENVSVPDSGVLRNLRLAMIGDSITRYQYLSLAYFAHNHRWVQDTDKPNILGSPRQWKSWEESNNYTMTQIVGGTSKERCNCHRPPGKINLQTYFTNRYFQDVETKNYLTLITKTGRPEAHGHWDPRTVYQDDFSFHEQQQQQVPATHQNFRWRYSTWSEIITNHLALLNPKPRYVVLNAGIWKQNDLTPPVFREIRQALDDHNMVGIYKTTTRRSWENYTNSQLHDHEGCRILHACLNLSWTGSLKFRGNYWDPVHFLAHTKFNRQLLNLIVHYESST